MTQHFFPELRNVATAAEAQGCVELNTRICEVILLDLIKHHDEAFDAVGPGTLVVNFNLPEDQQAGYVTLDGWEKDLCEAQRLKDSTFEEFFEKIIRAVKANADRSRVLLLLIDRSRQQLLPIPRDMPAERIRDLQFQIIAGATKKMIVPKPQRVKPEGFKKQ